MPRSLLTGLAAVCAVITAVLVAALFTRSTSDDPAFSANEIAIAASPGAVAYSISANGRDEVFIRNVEGDSPAHRVASFPYVYDLRLRGTTSPGGSTLAALHVDGGAGPAARLSFVDLRSGERRDVEGGFDYLSRMAWAPDASRIALVRRAEGTDPARGFVVAEVETVTLEVRDLHVFESALEVAPLGYHDGALLLAVVDDEGSTLWRLASEQAAPGPRFSSGLTSDWSLSPTGDRLAFVEHLGVGEHSRGGRVLSIATGRITPAAAAGEHDGAVWRPGSPVPDFGGPGGTLLLSDSEPGAYLVPLSWTPDGRYLIATVAGATDDSGSRAYTIEIVTSERRVHLADSEGVRFLGLASVE